MIVRKPWASIDILEGFYDRHTGRLRGGAGIEVQVEGRDHLRLELTATAVDRLARAGGPRYILALLRQTIDRMKRETDGLIREAAA